MEDSQITTKIVRDLQRVLAEIEDSAKIGSDCAATDMAEQLKSRSQEDPNLYVRTIVTQLKKFIDNNEEYFQFLTDNKHNFVHWAHGLHWPGIG